MDYRITQVEKAGVFCWAGQTYGVRTRAASKAGWFIGELVSRDGGERVIAQGAAEYARGALRNAIELLIAES
jgi:predicted Fe-Mo cluster-binding NifX family protein